jgi:hypothetical protein
MEKDLEESGLDLILSYLIGWQFILRRFLSN